MKYDRTNINLDNPSAEPEDLLSRRLDLKNIGISMHQLGAGEGFDFFHNHREQEEVYICLHGEATLTIAKDAELNEREHLTLVRGDAARLDAGILRALGNRTDKPATVLIVGGCGHPYPAGIGHHDVIADVLSLVGNGETGFSLPKTLTGRAVATIEDEDC